MCKKMKFVRYLSLLLLIFTGSFSHAANNYQDWWWNPAQSGMGLNVGQQNESIFVAWFNYGDDTKASFLTMGGVLNGNTLTGTLYRNTGPAPGPNYNPAQVKQTAVGTATLTFNSNTDAALTYSYDNKSGSMALQRFSFAEPNLNQAWLALDTYTITNCSNPTFNGSSSGISNVKIQKGTGTNFTMITSLDGKDICTASMVGQYAGSLLTANGSLVCNGGSASTVTIDDLTIQSSFLNLSYKVTGMQGDRSCIQKGALTGVVQKGFTQTYDFKTAFQNRILQGFSKTFNATGDCKGTLSLTESPAAKTTWNGQSVYAVGTTNIANMPNCTLGFSGTHTSITYYDMNFVELAKIDSDGTYNEYAKTSQPTTVSLGDTGILGTWNHWNNTSKTSKLESDVMSYVVEPDTTTSVIFNLIDRTYDNNNLLEITSQLRYRLNTTGILEWVSATIDFANNKGRLVLQ